MENDDPHILAAMDGQEFNLEAKPSTDSKREEPTAFFYIIFGLVYEALVTSSTDSSSVSSSRQILVVSALQALKCLVRPEYSGNAIKEPTIFDEFISLCYRIAMTEPAIIQVHLVEMLSTFASTQKHTSRSVILHSIAKTCIDGTNVVLEILFPLRRQELIVLGSARIYFGTPHPPLVGSSSVSRSLCIIPHVFSPPYRRRHFR